MKLHVFVFVFWGTQCGTVLREMLTKLSETEESKGCNYYLPDLKSDCNNGGKLL
jgi:hypothetical protein